MSSNTVQRSKQANTRNRSYLPKWVVLLTVLAGGVIYLFQRGTPVDQAMSNAVSGLSVLVVLGFYWLWFVFKGPAGTGLRRFVGWGSLGAVILLFSLIRPIGVTGTLIFEWKWRWEEIADRSLDSIAGQVIAGNVDLKTIGDRLDFPGFLGKDRHPFVTARWTAEPNESNISELWRRDIGAGWSGFAAVGGFGVTMEQRGEEEIISCYDLANGEIRWAHITEFRHETLLGGVGPRATPTIHKGLVYSLGPGGNLVCLDGKTGEQLWKRDVPGLVDSTSEQDLSVVSWGRSASPLVVDDLVIVPGGGPKGGPFVSLIALDRKSGDLQWMGGEEQISFASPAVYTINGKPQIVIVNESSVAGHDVKSGEELWKHPWDGSSTSSASNSQPYLAGEDLVFVAKGYGQGATVFQVKGNKTDEIWKNPSVARTKYTNAVLVDGKIYSLSDGILECANLATGDRIWKRGRFNHGQLLMVGELILVQSEEGELHFLRPEERGFQTLYQVQAMQDRCWATMALYGRKLILRNSEEVVCYELPIER